MNMEIKKEIKKESFGVKITLEEDGKVMGWAYLYVLPNDRHKEVFGFIENVYIEQEYRSGGLGRQLIETVITEAKERGCYKLIGTTRHSKPGVIAMYEKFGFKNHGIEFRMDLIQDSKVLTKD